MIQLIIEGFVHRLLPFYEEVTLGAIRGFNEADYPQAAAAAGVGALLASLALYGIGIWLRRLPKKISTDAQQDRIAALRKLAHEWLPYLLILSPTPIGGILIIAAGFFAIKPWMAAGMIILAEIAWRAAPFM
jgi:membrane protein YqaA with SNARE-associated domain